MYSKISLIMCYQSSVCNKIMEQLGQTDVDHRQRQVIIINQDAFYRLLDPEDVIRATKGEFNFDHPGKPI